MLIDPRSRTTMRRMSNVLSERFKIRLGGLDVRVLVLKRGVNVIFN